MPFDPDFVTGTACRDWEVYTQLWSACRDIFAAAGHGGTPRVWVLGNLEDAQGQRWLRVRRVSVEVRTRSQCGSLTCEEAHPWQRVCILASCESQYRRRSRYLGSSLSVRSSTR